MFGVSFHAGDAWLFFAEREAARVRGSRLRDALRSAGQDAGLERWSNGENSFTVNSAQLLRSVPRFKM